MKTNVPKNKVKVKLSKTDDKRILLVLASSEYDYLNKISISHGNISRQKIIRIMINYFLNNESNKQIFDQYVDQYIVRVKNEDKRELITDFISKNIDYVIDLLETNHLLDNLNFNDREETKNE